ncbi:MAG: ASKHA domain-containing protein [Clostridia bacterium]|nr:ASKHA domain-containing protein [Clostridia bacterium]
MDKNMMTDSAIKNQAEKGSVGLLSEAVMAARLKAARAEQERLAAPDKLLAAVDLGSTTVAVQIFDPKRPGQKITASGRNVLAAHVSDIKEGTRGTGSEGDQTGEMREAIRAQIRDLITAAVGDDRKPEAVCIAGNTVMERIAAGGEPASPGSDGSLSGDGSGWNMEGTAVSFAPRAAENIGGDVTAGIQASGVIGMEGRYLYLDIGTSTEAALIDGEEIVCCGTGTPALEGLGLSCGMAATAGAVSHVLFNGREWKLRTVGGVEPAGLCCSGIIDLLAQLLRTGMADRSGRLLSVSEQKPEYASFFTDDEDGNGVLHLTEDIRFTTGDLNRVLEARDAAAEAVGALIGKTGVAVDEVDQLMLAGGFGVHIDPSSACLAGIIPGELEMKTRSIGDASLTGACSAVTDPEAAGEIRTLAERCSCIEL